MQFHKIILKVLLGCLLPSTYVLGENSIKIDSALENVFLEDASATQNIMVEFVQKPSSVLDQFDLAKVGRDRTKFSEEYRRKLKILSVDSQEPVLNLLRDKDNERESFWVSNQVFVKDASKELVAALGKLPNVAKIRKEKVLHILKPVEEGQVIEGREGGNVLDKDSIKAIEWNIQKIKANDIWDKASKISANGGETVVGIIDTGIHPTHECFATNAIIGWKDAVNNKKKPYDDNGHGTHVAGTIAGQNGIGVAPGAKLVCCKACTGSGSCSESALTSCCQFMTEQHPTVVSNSWGGPSGTADYAAVIDGWKAMNIFSAFAAGNEGPSCKTIGSPADYPSVGCSVAATTNSDGLADFSSRGQCLNGLVGPTVSAPGKGVKSAWPSSDTAYKSLSGTSMATPHVAGLVALLHSMNSQITFDQIKTAIVHSCQASGLADPQQTCGGTSFDKVPNNMYGNGRIDCTKASQLLSKINENGEFIE